MKNIIKGFVIGIVFGVGGLYLWNRSRYEYIEEGIGEYEHPCVPCEDSLSVIDETATVANYKMGVDLGSGSDSTVKTTYKSYKPKNPITEYTSYKKIVEKYDTENTIPVIISEDEYFNAEEDYDKESLTYTKDSVLCTDTGELEEGLKSSIDWGSLFTDDVIYVRDSKLKIDYEVCKSNSTYNDLFGIEEV
jgi:hypothetical protein